MRFLTSCCIPLIAVLTVGLPAQTPPPPKLPSFGPATYGDVDAYQVYSAVLPMDNWYWGNSKTILILGEIPPREWPIGSPNGNLQGDEHFTKGFESIFKSFDEVNKIQLSLQSELTLQKPYKIVSRSKLDAAFHKPLGNTVGGGWEGFRQVFPDSAGYLILSGVGFNPDKTIALVYLEHRCGGLCGAARYYILQKRDGRWVRYFPDGLKSEMTGNA